MLNNNRLLKSILISSVASTFIFANSANDLVLEKLNQMEKKIKVLQAENSEIKTSLVSSNSSDSLDEFEERLDEIETLAMVNKINFGIGFRTRMDSFSGDYANGTTYTDNNILSSKVNLNMSSKITDDMKFTGRLTMYKYWAGKPQYNMGLSDAQEGRLPTDSGLYLERAYIDWTAIKGDIPVTFTIGRQPSTDGPSHQFKDNTVRKSTYSALAFDGASDGLVATIGLSKTTGIANTAFRVAYGKGYENHDSSLVGNGSTLKDTNILGLFLDSSIPSLRGSLLQVGYVTASDMFMPTPTGGMNFGDASLLSLTAEFSNLMNSGLDVFAHYGASNLDLAGSVAPMGMTGGDGSAYWLGGRYTLPFASKPKIGMEYNHGDENWFNFTSGANDLTNKLATRGDAFEIYYVQPINRYSFIRLGAQYIDYDYTGSGVPMAGQKITSASGQTLDKLSNYYLLFNVLY